MADEIYINDLTAKTTAFSLDDEIIVNEYVSPGVYAVKKLTIREMAENMVFCTRINNVNLLSSGVTAILSAGSSAKVIPVGRPTVTIETLTGSAGTSPQVNFGTSAGIYKEWTPSTSVAAGAVDEVFSIPLQSTLKRLDVATNALSVEVTAGTGYTTLRATIEVYWKIIP